MENKLMPGNILLCQGNSKLSKRIEKTQRIFGASKWEASFTHVAVLFDDHKIISVLESTTLNKWADKRGVQLNNYYEWLQNYNGHVWLKPLIFERTAEYQHKNIQFWERWKDTPYENGIAGAWELFWCGLQLSPFIKKVLPNWNPKPTDNIHCTELIGHYLIAHQFLSRKFFLYHSINRLRPAFWVKNIDKYLTVQAEPLIQLK